MRRALSALVTLVMMSVARRAAACAPWNEPPHLRSLATRAGLVVAAHRIDATLTLAGDPHADAFATFEVEAVLKGRPLARQIAVATRWLRDQGVELSPGDSAVLFLQESRDRYYPVRDDCLVRTLPVTDGKVLLEDIGVPFDVLAKELGFAWAESPQSSSPPSVPPVLLFAIGCAGAGFAFGHRMARLRAGERPTRSCRRFVDPGRQRDD